VQVLQNKKKMVMHINSHRVKVLSNSGFDVTVFDNLSAGCKSLVRYGKLVVGWLPTGIYK